MKNNVSYWALLGSLIVCLAVLLLSNSCTHDPFTVEEMDPILEDTMFMDHDTIMVDTTSEVIPCNDELVYFQNTILPIISGSCAVVACHDATTAAGDLILSNYENILEEVEPFDLTSSKLYERIIEDDQDKIMPPSGSLPSESISQIALWILQGAENNYCEEELICDSLNVSYMSDVIPIMEMNCNVCHNINTATAGIVTDRYQELVEIALDGRLFGSISWSTNYENMPLGSSKLEACDIAIIKNWIDEGAQNN